MWTYYRERHANDDWSLYREGEDHRTEVFNHEIGWKPSDMLLDRKHKGQIDSDDIITEEQALALIRSLPHDPG